MCDAGKIHSDLSAALFKTERGLNFIPPSAELRLRIEDAMVKLLKVNSKFKGQHLLSDDVLVKFQLLLEIVDKWRLSGMTTAFCVDKMAQ